MATTASGQTRWTRSLKGQARPASPNPAVDPPPIPSTKSHMPRPVSEISIALTEEESQALFAVVYLLNKHEEEVIKEMTMSEILTLFEVARSAVLTLNHGG